MESDPCPTCGFTHPGLVHETAPGAISDEVASELAEASVEIAQIEADEHIETAEIYAATDEARIEANTEVELAQIEAAEHIEVAAIEAEAEIAIAEEESEIAIAEVVAEAIDGGNEEGDESEGEGSEDGLTDEEIDEDGAIPIAPPPRIENEQSPAKASSHRSAFASRHQRVRKAN